MWILPSRGRPHNVARFFECYAKTQGSTPGVLCVDEDDPRLKEYQALAMPPGWVVRVFPRLWMVPKVNRAFDEHPGRDWYGFIDDDAVPVTSRWDERLVQAAGKDGIAHCFNGIGNERLASQFVMGGELARRLGWVLLKGVNRLWGDNAVTAVGKKFSCITYLPDVSVEQWHFSNGKAPMDAIYMKPEAKDDARVYQEWYARFIEERSC